jgi:hypothetical protein
LGTDRLATDSIQTGASAVSVWVTVVNLSELPGRAERIAMMLDTFGVKANDGQPKGEQSDGTAFLRMTGRTATQSADSFT